MKGNTGGLGFCKDYYYLAINNITTASIKNNETHLQCCGFWFSKDLFIFYFI